MKPLQVARLAALLLCLPGNGVPAAQPRLLSAHTDSVYGLAFFPDGKALASAGADEVVRLWDVAGGEVRLTFARHEAPVYCAAFSPDGKSVASAGGDHKVRLWDAATGKELRVFAGHTDAVYCAAFSPDGKTLASGGKDGTVRLGTWPAGRSWPLSRGTAARSTASPSALTARRWPPPAATGPSACGTRPPAQSAAC